MHGNKYSISPYGSWPTESHSRWIRAGNAFGAHFTESVRDHAVELAQKDGIPEEHAIKVVDTTLYALMAFLDGVYGYRDIDDHHWMNYVLQANVMEKSSSQVVETFELAPDGDGLGMGLAGWLQGDFGQNQAPKDLAS